MKCIHSEYATFIQQPGMTAVDHLINMGRLILRSKTCECSLCQSLAMPSELGIIAVNVELHRRHNPVKVFEALVEGWDAEKIITEFAYPPE